MCLKQIQAEKKTQIWTWTKNRHKDIHKYTVHKDTGTGTVLLTSQMLFFNVIWRCPFLLSCLKFYSWNWVDVYTKPRLDRCLPISVHLKVLQT